MPEIYKAAMKSVLADIGKGGARWQILTGFCGKSNHEKTAFRGKGSVNDYHHFTVIFYFNSTCKMSAHVYHDGGLLSRDDKDIKLLCVSLQTEWCGTTQKGIEERDKDLREYVKRESCRFNQAPMALGRFF